MCVCVCGLIHNFLVVYVWVCVALFQFKYLLNDIHICLFGYYALLLLSLNMYFSYNVCLFIFTCEWIHRLRQLRRLQQQRPKFSLYRYVYGAFVRPLVFHCVFVFSVSQENVRLERVTAHNWLSFVWETDHVM